MANEIESHSHEQRCFEPTAAFRETARIGTVERYQELYEQSIATPEKFWAEQAEAQLHWFRRWDHVMSYDFESIGTTEAPYVQFFKGAKLNACYNCLDRHIESSRRDKAAILWQGEAENDKRQLTYAELHQQVCKFANVLRSHGVTKGSTVTIYMPMIPEVAIAMLACARIGAVHSVVFSAFSADALASRIQDGHCETVITADSGVHAGKLNELKKKVDQALARCPSVRRAFVVNRGNSNISMQAGRDFWWHEEMESMSAESEAEEMDAEDPLFMLYTSGSTGKPKGVLHTTAGYLLYTTLTSKWVFDLRDRDVYWCTADVGWITGHSYLIYGPLSNGATCLMFEGVPTYPEPDRFWKIVDDYKVSVFYTAPTALRALMRLGDSWPEKHDLSSLRLLGTVGEPINPEAWMWYRRVIGKNCCPIVDTWWQTETGGIMITTLPGAHAAKPGSAGMPFFGVVPEIVRENGTPIVGQSEEGGYLLISQPWPGMIRGVFGDPKHELIKKVYFERFPGKYMTGDGCRRDKDGYYWLLGRIDDVINVSAHRFATAEIESSLVAHDAVTEAAVVGRPHDTKGQAIYCYVTLRADLEPSEALRKELIQHVRDDISPIATPEVIHFTPALPKTRSGKIMRRILRKIAEGKIDEIGDTSTLADPSVVESLLEGRE